MVVAVDRGRKLHEGISRQAQPASGANLSPAVVQQNKRRPIVFIMKFVTGALFVVISFHPPAFAQAVDSGAIDAIVEDALKFWHVPGVAIGIVRNDKVVYLKGHGVKEVGKPDSVTPDTVFPLASCTKAFTTRAMAMLVD